LRAGHHQMVEDGDVHRFANQRQPARDALVGGAWARVAAGMVVGQDQALAAMPRGVGDDGADRQFGAVGMAVVAAEVQAPRIVVDMGDPQMFLGRIGIGQAAREETACLLKSGKAQRGFGTLMEHGVNLCQGTGSGDLNRIRNGYPFWRYCVANQDIAFFGSIPAIYDCYMVPLVFAPFAEEVARRAAGMMPERVLETAAGTGAVTEALHRALPDAEIIATDLNGPMLEVAAQRVRSAKVSFEVADAQELHFAEASFDLVVCQFGVMFFPDKVRANAEARRVLRDGGSYLLVVWDHVERNLATMVAGQAVAELIPGEAARFYERVPFRYHDKARIEQDLRAAGFERIAIDTVERRSRVTSARDAALALVQGTPMRADIEAVAPDLLGPATDAAAEALARFEGPDGFDAPMSAHIVVATK